MNEFVPHKIDAEESFESHLLGDVKAGFPAYWSKIVDKIGAIN